MKFAVIAAIFGIIIFSCSNLVENEKELEPIKKSHQRIWVGRDFGFIDEAGDTIIPLGLYSKLSKIDEREMILASKDSKWGYIDIDQNILIPFLYDYLSLFYQELAVAKRGGKYGFINRQGEVVIPFEFDKASYFSWDLAGVKKDGKYGYVDKKGQIVVSFFYDEIRFFYSPGLAIVKKDGKFGFVNQKGEEVIPTIFDKVGQPYYDSIVIASIGHRWAFFSKEGKQLSGFEFDQVIEATANIKEAEFGAKTYFGNGPALVRRNDHLAFIDANMSFVVPFGEFNKAEPFNPNRLAIVRKGRQYGIIDEKGNTVVDFLYDAIEHPTNYSHIGDVFVVKKNGLYQILDNKASPITELGFKHWKYGSKGEPHLILTNTDNKVGVVSVFGEELIPFEYSRIFPFQKEVTVAIKDNKFGLININNNVILPFQFEQIQTTIFSTNFIVTINEKMGVVDDGGNMILPFEYESIFTCYYDQDNKFIVKKGNKYGIVDKLGKVIIPMEYDGISNWVEYGPRAHFVIKDDKKGIISRDGSVILPVIFDYLVFELSGFYVAGIDGKHGVFTYKGQELVPLEYQKIVSSSDLPKNNNNDHRSEFYVKKDNRYYAINLQNEVSRNSLMKKERDFLNGLWRCDSEFWDYFLPKR